MGTTPRVPTKRLAPHRIGTGDRTQAATRHPRLVSRSLVPAGSDILQFRLTWYLPSLSGILAHIRAGNLGARLERTKNIDKRLPSRYAEHADIQSANRGGASAVEG